MTIRLSVIGVGLIGGSIALAARRSGCYESIVGYDANTENLQQAYDLGMIDQASSTLAAAVDTANLVVIATPVGAIRKILTHLQPLWNSHCVYTDVGSTKQSVVNDAEEVFGAVPDNFVAGHPIAGTEKSGANAAFAELFDHKHIILTPLPSTKQRAIQIVRKFWEQAAHAIVSEMEPVQHDRILAATSHLPHVAAYALVNLLASQDESSQIFQFAASGFRDFTRIASSDPRMWADICVANRQQLVPLLENYQSELGELIRLLDSGHHEQLFEHFSQARHARQGFVDMHHASK
ncbi:MAG TPA: prephenate dehydrogenase/arogenate dehydrogenase family protein [Crenotrichaceae bacterium]|nr:prephenate dehydrogenase/arogenate dehydrogenase family protein [Crenotrichaceae bacterium]